MASQYPPPHHVLRDLAPVVRITSPTEGSALLALRPELAGPSGGVSAGPLAVLVDMLGGGLAARAAYPGWIATADLTLHLVSTPATGEIEAVGRVLRKGRTTVVLEVELRASDEPAGLASMTFAVLPRRRGNPDIARADNGAEADEPSAWLAGGNLTEPFDEALGLRVIDAASGVVEAPLLDYSLNSLGALQGGIVATLACLAAEQAVGTACHAPVTAVDLHVTYLALNKVGPVRTRTEVLAATETYGCALVETIDADGRVTATAGVVAGLAAVAGVAAATT